MMFDENWVKWMRIYMPNVKYQVLCK